MRVLIIGAYGFIGSAIARDLCARGHEVTGLGRDTAYGRRILPRLRWVTADLCDMTAPQAWEPLLVGMDAVVNASGLLQEGDGGTVEAVQLHAVRALLEACEVAGVKRFVQISAAGADPNAQSEFMATKGQANALVEASSLNSLIVRPGLVIGRNSYGGTELLRSAAAAFVALRLPFKAPIQCVAMSDVVEAVACALDPLDPRYGGFDLVERQAHSLDEIIALHRHWLGLPPARQSFHVPEWLLRVASRVADLLGRLGWRSPLRRNALLALGSGVSGDPEQTVALLGREPLALEASLDAQPAGKQDRLHAHLGLLQPLMLAALFIMWAGSGLATLLQVDRAIAILHPSGVGEQWAYAIAVLGGSLDIILAAGLIWRRTVKAALLIMIGVTLVAYLGVGTLLAPYLWLDPLAPLPKALPATVLALVAYWLVEKR
jgi:uncharacterized protein YbjT (DUF2867 family)